MSQRPVPIGQTHQRVTVRKNRPLKLVRDAARVRSVPLYVLEMPGNRVFRLFDPNRCFCTRLTGASGVQPLTMMRRYDQTRAAEAQHKENPFEAA